MQECFLLCTPAPAGNNHIDLDKSQVLLQPGNWEDMSELSLMPAQFSFKALKDLNIILGLISVLEVELASTLFSMCKRKCNLQSEASQASFPLALLAWKQNNLFQLLICKDYLLCFCLKTWPVKFYSKFHVPKSSPQMNLNSEENSFQLFFLSIFVFFLPENTAEKFYSKQYEI